MHGTNISEIWTKKMNYHKWHNNKLLANQSLLWRADNSVYRLFVRQLQNQQHTSTISVHIAVTCKCTRTNKWHNTYGRQETFLNILVFGLFTDTHTTVNVYKRTHTHTRRQSGTNQAFTTFVRIINKNICRIVQLNSEWNSPGKQCNSLLWLVDEKLAPETRSIAFNMMREFGINLFWFVNGSFDYSEQNIMHPDTKHYFRNAKQSNQISIGGENSRANCIHVVFGGNTFRCFCSEA